MISYHFLWDLVYLYNADIPWYKSHGAYIWQQSICWTFILLAGFSWHLGKKHMKRGLWAFGGGVVVSLVTAIVLPNDRVRYGVLTLIGSCILIWILLDKVLKKIPAGVGVSVSFVLFLILRSWTKQDPIQLSDNLLNVTWLKSVLAYIGFPQAGFSSTDYFPLLPWIFLFATGYFLYSFLQEKGLISASAGCRSHLQNPFARCIPIVICPRNRSPSRSRPSFRRTSIGLQQSHAKAGCNIAVASEASGRSLWIDNI